MFFSCEENEKVSYQNIKANLFLSIIDKKGKDLLDPDNNEISLDDIKVYYKEESGKLNLFNKPSLDNPKGFGFVAPSLESSSSRYFIDLFLNTVYVYDNQSCTVLVLRDGKTYEIKTYFSKEKESIIAQKIFINGELVVDIGDNRLATIVLD